MSKELSSNTFGSEMKKYAKCTMIASVITLILGAVLQYLWFKYDAILREGWLRISYEGYTSDEEAWVSFFQSPILDKIIPICSFISLGILLFYMVYDVLKDVHANETSLDRFLAKFAAVGIFSAVSSAILALAAFWGNGCLTYNNGFFQLEERCFLPIGGYTYDQVWSKHPSVNVKYYVYAFLMVLFVFLCLYLTATLVSAIVTLSERVENASVLGILAVAAAIVLAARTSILVVILLVAVLLAANIAMQVISAKRMENRHQMV